MMSGILLSGNLNVRHISYREGAVMAYQLPLQGTGIRSVRRILVSTGLGDLVPNALDLVRASFDFEAQSLFHDGVYEGG